MSAWSLDPPASSNDQLGHNSLLQELILASSPRQRSAKPHSTVSTSLILGKQLSRIRVNADSDFSKGRLSPHCAGQRQNICIHPHLHLETETAGRPFLCNRAELLFASIILLQSLLSGCRGFCTIPAVRLHDNADKYCVNFRLRCCSTSYPTNAGFKGNSRNYPKWWRPVRLTLLTWLI